MGYKPRASTSPVPNDYIIPVHHSALVEIALMPPGTHHNTLLEGLADTCRTTHFESSHPTCRQGSPQKPISTNSCPPVWREIDVPVEDQRGPTDGSTGLALAETAHVVSHPRLPPRNGAC